MSRTIFCAKLKQEAEGFDAPPIPGALGQRVYQEVSKQAWSMWLSHQTMLINEYRLSLIDPQARQFLAKEMDNYFFGDGATMPQGYTPE